MKAWFSALVVIAALNVAVAVWPRQADGGHLAKDGTKSFGGPAHTASGETHAGDTSSHAVRPLPRLRAALGQVDCATRIRDLEARMATYRELLRTSWIMSQNFASLRPNGIRLEEVKNAASEVLGRSLPDQNFDCRGPRGQICNIVGLSHKENMSLQRLGQLDWGKTTLVSMELGGPEGVFVRLREPGRQPGRPLLEQFAEQFRASGRIVDCASHEPGRGALRITLSIPTPPEELGDPASEVPAEAQTEDVGEKARIVVQNAEARPITPYEQCVLDAVRLAARDFPVPRRTAPAMLVGIRFGSEGEGRL